jgi:hypothetical protein
LPRVRRKGSICHAIVCQINILAGVQTLVWQNQAKAWTPFSESLYNILKYRFQKGE